MIKSPGRSNGYLALVKTLDAGTWLLTFVILLFGSALASLPYYIHRGCRGQKSARSEVEPGFMGLGECLYQSFALLCQQGETQYGALLVRTECNNNIYYLKCRPFAGEHYFLFSPNHLGVNPDLHCGCIRCLCR